MRARSSAPMIAHLLAALPVLKHVRSHARSTVLPLVPLHAPPTVRIRVRSLAHTPARRRVPTDARLLALLLVPQRTRPHRSCIRRLAPQLV